MRVRIIKQYSLRGNFFEGALRKTFSINTLMYSKKCFRNIKKRPRHIRKLFLFEILNILYLQYH